MSRQIRRLLRVMLMADIAVLLVIVLLSRLVAVTLLSSVGLPFLLIFNFLFIRYTLKSVNQPPKEGVR